MVPFNLKVLAKFGLCSNCLQKLHGYSLARACKIFASAHIQMLSLQKYNKQSLYYFLGRDLSIFYPVRLFRPSDCILLNVLCQNASRARISYFSSFIIVYIPCVINYLIIVLLFYVVKNWRLFCVPNSFSNSSSCFANVNAVTITTGDDILNPVLFVFGYRVLSTY